MASEIRVDKINSLSGVGTVTLSPTGVDIAGITTAATLRATTGIVTSLTAGSLTSLGAVSGTTANFTGGSATITGTTATLHLIDENDNPNYRVQNNDGTFRIYDATSDASRLNINSSGNTGIGEDSPANLLHVKVSDTGVSPHASAQIVLERSGTNYLQFLTANSGTSGILFGDGDDADVAQIKYDHNVPAMQFITETGERMRIDSSGRLMLGTTTEGFAGADELTLATSGSTGITIRSGTSNDGNIYFSDGDDGSSAEYQGYVQYEHAHGRLNVGTEGTTKLKVDGANVLIASGNLKFETSGKGIDFSATGDGSGTMTNELLDDYEEGTWSISVTPGGGSFSVSHMNARYVRIGNVVTVQGWWRAAGISGVSGSLTVSGLPYAALDYSSGGGVRQTLKLDVAHVNYSGLTFVKLRIGNNSAQGSIMGNTAGASGGVNTWTAGNIAVSTELYISGSYITG